MSGEPRGSFVTVTETSYVEAVWYVELSGNAGNWMACLYRDRDDAPWRCSTRFRWYHDDKAWGSSDRRQMIHATAEDGSEASREKLFALVEVLATKITDSFRGALEFGYVRGGVDAFSAFMARQSWTSTRTETLEDGSSEP